MATVEERVVEEEGEREAEHDLQPAEERWEDKAQVEAQQAEDNDQGTAHVDGIKYDDPVLSSGGWRMRRGREVGRMRRGTEVGRMRRGREVGRNEKEGQVGRMRRGRGGGGMRRWRPSPPSDRAARFLVDRGLQSACARNDMRRPPAPPATPLQEGPAPILGEY